MAKTLRQQQAADVFWGFRDKWTYPSSSSDRMYTVMLHEDGHLSCDCRGWINLRGHMRDCTHQRTVIAQQNFKIDKIGDNAYVYVK
jgi:hypothetical protein